MIDESEIIEFLNQIDSGYIGFSKPQVILTKPTALEELWAIQDRRWPEGDNEPGSPEQAWA